MERFEEKVDRLTPFGPKGDCHRWTSVKMKCGYGYFWHKGKYVRAHRFAYEQAKGPIPEGLCVRHKCDQPDCVNPEHLETGTNMDNSRDMVERARHPGRPLHPHRTSPRKDSASGIVGVHRDARRRCWIAQGQRIGFPSLAKYFYEGSDPVAARNRAIHARKEWEQACK